MNKAFIILFLFTIVSKTVSAQAINVIGKVIDKMTKDPVENAMISVYNEKKTVFNAVSDSSGTFKIPFVFYRKASSIKIHILSYSDFKIDFIPKIDTAAKRDYFLGIYKINPQSTELKEMSVKARRRYSDTSRIDLSKEKFEHSVMIDDIFSSNFGFTRDANGQLYFKGKPISNVLVNGGDFFGKNNMDVYHLLPALILDNIQVVETNIDSVTNTGPVPVTLTVNCTLYDANSSNDYPENLNVTPTFNVSPAVTTSTTYWNVAESGTFNDKSCGTGSMGTAVTYTVPAHTYSSTTSQSAANQLAISDVNTNGQNYANTHGHCTPVYARIEGTVNSGEGSNMVIHFYADQPCTTPLALPGSVTVTVTWLKYNSDGSSYTVNSVWTVSQGASTFYMGHRQFYPIPLPPTIIHTDWVGSVVLQSNPNFTTEANSGIFTNN